MRGGGGAMGIVLSRKSRPSWQGVLASFLIGMSLFWFMSFIALPLSVPITMKLKGNAGECPWPRVLSSVRENTRFSQLMDQIAPRLSVAAKDENRPIEK